MPDNTALTKAAEIMSGLRQTGRTSRLLNEAERLDAEGHAVYIVAATEAHTTALRQALKWRGASPSIKVEGPHSLVNLDWLTLTLRGAHRNCRVLVDHHAIESRYAAVLEMLHRFDPD